MYTQISVTNRTPVASLPAPNLLWREALVMLVCLGVLSTGHIGGLVLGMGLAVWSLRSSTAALQSLTLLMLLTSLNLRLYPVPLPGMLKWMVLLLALGSAIFHCVRNYRGVRSAPIPRWLLTLLLFVVVTLLLSIVSSGIVELSVFKLVIFTIGVCGTMAIFADPRVDLHYGLSWFATLFTVAVGASVPFLWSAVAYLKGTTYFTGIMWHSQLFGIFLAPFIVYALSRWLLALSPISRLEKGVCLVALVMLYLTYSRTAVLTVLFSTIVLLGCGYARGVVSRRLLGRVFMLGGLLALVLVAVNMTTHRRLTAKMQAFLQKRGDVNTTILASRETKFTEAYHTFHDHMLAGVGFGMPVNDRDIPVVERDPILQLPLSAPVEASVMYMALPAQIGLIGLLPFLAFIMALAAPMARYAPLPILGLSLSAFVTNFGEYAFFAFGSIGLLWWLLFALSHAYGVRKEPFGMP